MRFNFRSWSWVIKRTLFSLLFLTAFTLTAYGQAELLPEDAPFVAQVVHGVKYPVTGRWSLDVGAVKYYGERLASTWGYGIQPTYHLSEKLWLALPFYFFKSSAVSGASYASWGSSVVALDPQMFFGPIVGYNPIYGKFVVGEHIQHFRAGFNGGLVGLQMNDVLGNSFSGSAGGAWTYGLQAGLQIQAQLDANWMVNLFSTALAYQLNDSAAADAGSFRIGWLYGLSTGRSF